MTRHFLADTSAWNRSGLVIDRWSELVERDELVLCTPVLLELLYSARGRRDYAQLREDLRGFATLPLDAEAAQSAERTQALLAERSQHRGPRPMDLLVAAIAEARDVTLLHYDRHFDAIARVTGQRTEWIAARGSLD